MAETIAKKVTYDGYVQGVGFRHTASSLARQFAVTGYVQNISGGKVEVLVEGLRDEVEAYLTALGEEMREYIQNTTVQDLAPSGQYNRFTVKFV